MSVAAGPDVVEDGLVVFYDFKNTKCYPGSGTAVSDLIINKSGTMVGTCSFQSGAMDFTGPTDNTTLTISPLNNTPALIPSKNEGSKQEAKLNILL